MINSVQFTKDEEQGHLFVLFRVNSWIVDARKPRDPRTTRNTTKSPFFRVSSCEFVDSLYAQKDNPQNHTKHYLLFLVIGVTNLFDPHKARCFAVLSHLIDREGLIVHHDINTRTKYPNSKEALGKVLQTITSFKS